MIWVPHPRRVFVFAARVGSWLAIQSGRINKIKKRKMAEETTGILRYFKATQECNAMAGVGNNLRPAEGKHLCKS
jgi:hypothetical protein